MSDTAEVKTLIIDEQEVSARAGRPSLKWRGRTTSTFPPSAIWTGFATWARAACAWSRSRAATSCCPPAWPPIYEGMEVSTNTERLQPHRRTILEMLFAERNHICSVCVANGHCELQSLAQEQGLTHVRLPYRNPELPVDASHERFTVDHNRCILCTRCVRVCAEVEGAHVWDVMGRGINSMVITDLHEDWGESSCTRCGKCVQVCPTGALFDKSKIGADHPKYPDFLPYLNLMREAQ